MKIIRYLSSIVVLCLVSQCGSFNAAYTDPKTGAIFHGGVDAPKSAVVDNKSSVNDGP